MANPSQQPNTLKPSLLEQGPIDWTLSEHFFPSLKAGQAFPPVLPPHLANGLKPALQPTEGAGVPATREELQAILSQLKEINKELDDSVLSKSDHEAIRALVREEARSVPPSKLSYVSFGIAITAFGIAIWNYWRASSKIKQDFSSRRNDREELLFGREPSVVEEPKQLLVQEFPSQEPGMLPIIEVDDPRLEVMSFDPDRDFGPYTMELAKQAASLCTPQDPFLLEHFSEVRVPRFSWLLDAGAERNRRHLRALTHVSSEKIRTRALNRFKRELKIVIEKAFSEGAIDALEGKTRTRQTLFAVPLSDVKPDGNWTMKFLVVSENDLLKMRDPKVLERMIQDNPEKRREIELVAMADVAERKFQDGQLYEQSAPSLYRLGHSRYSQQRRVGHYMIAVGGWLRPKNANGK